MEKTKRTERIAAATRILTESPNKIISYSVFCDLFSAAKSSVSEDIALVSESLQKYGLGTVETLPGAAGGVRFRPAGDSEQDLAFVEQLCTLFSEENRRLPGGYLYFSDLLSDPVLVRRMGRLIASRCYDTRISFVLTMETKGIPVALMCAEALRVPLIIARHATKVYEGSAVNISYATGSGKIETMALSRRAVKEGQTALIVDDFMRGGGTANGMVSLMREFGVSVAGVCFVLALNGSRPVLPNRTFSLMQLDALREGEPIRVRPADWILQAAGRETGSPT